MLGERKGWSPGESEGWGKGAFSLGRDLTQFWQLLGPLT